jgi:hypothetical protein
MIVGCIVAVYVIAGLWIVREFVRAPLVRGMDGDEDPFVTPQPRRHLVESYHSRGARVIPFDSRRAGLHSMPSDRFLTGDRRREMPRPSRWDFDANDLWERHPRWKQQDQGPRAEL